MGDAPDKMTYTEQANKRQVKIIFTLVNNKFQLLKKD